MRLLHPSLGLTALVAAFAVGLRTEEATSQNHPAPQSPITHSHHPQTSSTRTKITPTSQRQKTEPLTAPHLTAPHLAAPHLADLTRTLSLSHTQQAEIHPAILRSSLHYDPSKQYQIIHQKSHHHLGPPMTRADFEDALFAILNVDQQLDYAATVTEKEAWWNSVISRLESDLESQTPPTIVPSQGRDRQLQLPPVTD